MVLRPSSLYPSTSMSKERWFAQYERLEAEFPDWSDDKLSEAALEAQRDEMADQADMMVDQQKEQGVLLDEDPTNEEDENWKLGSD